MKMLSKFTIGHRRTSVHIERIHLYIRMNVCTFYIKGVVIIHSFIHSFIHSSIKHVKTERVCSHLIVIITVLHRWDDRGTPTWGDGVTRQWPKSQRHRVASASESKCVAAVRLSSSRPLSPSCHYAFQVPNSLNSRNDFWFHWNHPSTPCKRPNSNEIIVMTPPISHQSSPRLIVPWP